MSRELDDNFTLIRGFAPDLKDETVRDLIQKGYQLIVHEDGSVSFYGLSNENSV